VLGGLKAVIYTTCAAFILICELWRCYFFRIVAIGRAGMKWLPPFNKAFPTQRATHHLSASCNCWALCGWHNILDWNVIWRTYFGCIGIGVRINCIVQRTLSAKDVSKPPKRSALAGFLNFWHVLFSSSRAYCLCPFAKKELDFLQLPCWLCMTAMIPAFFRCGLKRPRDRRTALLH